MLSIPPSDLMCRYITTCYAYWRIFKYPLCSMKPAVNDLVVHLEGEQNVSIKKTANLGSVVAKDFPTQLTEWLAYNRIHPTCDVAKDLTYVQFPQRFRWMPGNKGIKDPSKFQAPYWKMRSNRSRRARQRQVAPTTLGRIFWVKPTEREPYCLRLLLHHQKGCKSFEDIRTVQGHVYGTYQEAARACGLITSEDEWSQAIRAAYEELKGGSDLRSLLVTIMVANEPPNLREIWDANKAILCEDFHIQEVRAYM